MSVRKFRSRGWLIFFGVVAVLLALPLLKIRVGWMLRHLAIPVLLAGVVLLVLAWLAPGRARNGHRRQP